MTRFWYGLTSRLPGFAASKPYVYAVENYRTAFLPKNGIIAAIYWIRKPDTILYVTDMKMFCFIRQMNPWHEHWLP
jgi:hypothetical protein